MTLIAVKFVDGSDDMIEGLALPFGGPAGGKDLTGTYFDSSTNFCKEWFPDGGRPLLYRHGFDAAIKASVIGRETGGRDDERGHWQQAQLDRSHEYWAEVKSLIAAGTLFMSSGAVDHLVDVTPKTGAIRMWPWVETSLVPNPANPDQPAVREAPSSFGYAVKSLDAIEHLAVLGIAAPPALTVKASEAAADASGMARTLGDLLRQLGDEDDEAQAGLIRSMTELAQAYIAAEVAEVGTPEDIAETVGQELRQLASGWLSADRAIKAGARNSASDTTMLTDAHDAIASVLGLDCSGSSAGKAADIEPAHVLAIKAGDGVETVSPERLAVLTDEMARGGLAAIKEALGIYD